MAKCQCGREMLKANGCRFKRIEIQDKRTKTEILLKEGDNSGGKDYLLR